MDFVTTISARAWQVVSLCGARLVSDLFSVASQVSLYSLATAFGIALLWMFARHGPIRPRLLWRALFPRRWRTGPSARADWGFTALNIFLTGTLIGWAILSSGLVAELAGQGLVALFGPAPQVALLPHWLATAVVTVALFLAYETAYFVDHYLSHHVPLLWHFHRTHHTAETLSPLTNFRVHPVDSLVFYNFVSLCTGSVIAVTTRWLPGTEQFALGGGNAFIVVGLYLLTHLHHSHMWIAFTGAAGRLIMSPAHHQLHHSESPAHFNRNFGNTLAVFDWIAGTLHVPSKARIRLTYGSGPYPVDPHGIAGGLIQPFVEAAGEFGKRSRRDDGVPGVHAADLSFR